MEDGPVRETDVQRRLAAFRERAHAPEANGAQQPVQQQPELLIPAVASTSSAAVGTLVRNRGQPKPLTPAAASASSAAVDTAAPADRDGAGRTHRDAASLTRGHKCASRDEQGSPTRRLIEAAVAKPTPPHSPRSRKQAASEGGTPAEPSVAYTEALSSPEAPSPQNCASTAVRVTAHS